MMIHDSISINNNIGQDLLTDQYSQDTARNGCKQGIAKVFGCDRPLTVSQRFHRPDLHPLLLYHTRHAGQADQRGNQKEQHRKYPADGTHPVCIFPVAGIFRQCASVIDIPGCLRNILNLCLSIRNLLFPLRKLLGRLGPAFFQLFLRFRKLCFIFRDFRFSVP